MSKGILGNRRIAIIVLITFLTAGCGDGEGDGDAAVSAGSSSGSSGVTLSIGGSPPSQVMVGTQFSYTPTVSNPAGVVLTFSATGLPAWATINSSTGQVTGTPDSGDVGVYGNIRITVSGGGASDTSPLFSVEVVAVAQGSATLTWTPPTQNADGSPLTDLAGYRIYWGLTPNDLSNSVTLNNAGITSYVVENLTPATWYFAASSINSSNFESALSNTATKTIF